MRIRTTATAVSIVVLGFACTAPQRVAAQPGEVRVVSSNGMRAVMEELRPRFEQAIGHPIAIEFSSAAALKKKIEAGEPFDFAVLTPEGIDDLIKQGKIAAGARADIARCGVGVGIRAGAPRPDISTPDALKRVLLSAKSITYAKDGASRILADKAFERLGIADILKPKIILGQGGETQTSVAEGKVELVLTLISEILPVPGIELLGPLPADVQGYVSFAGGVATNARNSESGKALLKLLSGPSAAPVIKAKGMEPR
jgi:molybdate transport system substrate-binding protein